MLYMMYLSLLLKDWEKMLIFVESTVCFLNPTIDFLRLSEIRIEKSMHMLIICTNNVNIDFHKFC